MSDTPARTFSLSFPQPDIALLTLDMPGKSANILSRPVLEELNGWLDQLAGRTDLAGLIFQSAKPGIFIAGADLREFAASLGSVKPEDVIALCRQGQSLFGQFTQMPFVTVAAIDGICVGGGCELVVWCDRRVVTDNPKTELGFPEVKLGLIPGWGGTVRAPRLVGLANALELITSGESIDGKAAVAMGLADDLVPSNRLLDAAIDLVRDDQKTGRFRTDRQRRSNGLTLNDTELGFLGLTASAVIQDKTKGQYPAPLAGLELMMETVAVDAETACRREAEAMSKLFGSPINAALINVFFLTDRIKRDTGVEREGLSPREIKSVGVIGSGIMGSGIAAANVKRKLSVVITDVSAEALAKGSRTVLEEVSFDKKAGGPDVKRALDFAPFLHSTTSDAELAACDLVIEAATENPDIKKQIFQRLEPKLKPDAILATNTSTIPISLLAAAVQRPGRFCGIHFFNPVRRMQLVEVIRGTQTTDETVVTAVAYAKQVGKLPIVVNDGPGFLVNRLLFPYMASALELVVEGVEIKAIERAAKSFGLPMGPIELYDIVGLDTALYAGRTMAQAFPDRFGDAPLLRAMVEAKRLGQKTGLGFYSFNNRKKRAEPDPGLDAFLAPFIAGDKKKLSTEELTSRLFLPMLLEATRALQDKIVRNVRDVDFGLIYGIGFPPFKGGLLFWADTLGAAKIVEMLKPFAARGPAYQPTPLLLEMAATGKKFYA